MKRVIKAAGRRIPKTRPVYEVCEAMGYDKPLYVDPTVNGYKVKWGGLTIRQRVRKQLADALVSQSIRSEVLRELSKSTYYRYKDNPEKLYQMLYPGQSAAYDMYLNALNRAKSEVAEADIQAKMQEMLDDIYNQTGYDCHFTREGNLVIPYGPEE